MYSYNCSNKDKKCKSTSVPVILEHFQKEFPSVIFTPKTQITSTAFKLKGLTVDFCHIEYYVISK